MARFLAALVHHCTEKRSLSSSPCCLDWDATKGLTILTGICHARANNEQRATTKGSQVPLRVPKMMMEEKKGERHWMTNNHPTYEPNCLRRLLTVPAPLWV